VTDGPVASAAKLPPKVWIVVGVGTVGFFFYTKSRSAATASTATTSDPTLNGSANGGATSGAGDVGSGPGGWVSGTSPLPNEQNAPSSPATNEEWAYKAEQDLIARGYSPTLVDSALRHYITGQLLSTSEWAVISIALSLEGPPPEQIGGNVGTPPTRVPPTTPPPPPTQASPPRKAIPPPIVRRPTSRPPRYYTVQRGDTLWKIAQHYYRNGALWPKIYNANRSIIKNPNRIQVGWRLVIPY